MAASTTAHGLLVSVSVSILLQLGVCQLSPALPTLPTLPTAIPTFPSKVVLFNATDLVDKVINETRRQVIILGLDDIHTPDVAFRVNNYSVAIGNGSIKGLANVHRVGDVLVTTESLGVFKIRSAFEVTNVTADYDVDVVTNRVRYEEGHVHADVDNVTVYQVFKYEILTQTLTLDEFELSVGNVNYNVTGLGDRAQNDSVLITTIIKKTKTPALILFNIAFRTAVNAALAVIRAALLAAVG